VSYALFVAFKDIIILALLETSFATRAVAHARLIE